MNDLVPVLQNSPKEVAEAEEAAETAKYQSEMALAVAFLRAREEYPSIEDAKQAARVDEDYQEARAEEIISTARYKELSNRQINARKLSDLQRATL